MPQAAIAVENSQKQPKTAKNSQKQPKYSRWSQEYSSWRHFLNVSFSEIMSGMFIYLYLVLHRRTSALISSRTIVIAFHESPFWPSYGPFCTIPGPDFTLVLGGHGGQKTVKICLNVLKNNTEVLQYGLGSFLEKSVFVEKIFFTKVGTTPRGTRRGPLWTLAKLLKNAVEAKNITVTSRVPAFFSYNM